MQLITTKSGFIISGNDFPHLRIGTPERQIDLEQSDKQIRFKIEDIVPLFDEQHPHLTLYTTDDVPYQISEPLENITAKESLNLTYLEKTYWLAITDDKQIVVLAQPNLPSEYFYNQDAQLTGLKTQYDSLILGLTFSTKFSAPEQIQLTIRVRHTKAKITLPATRAARRHHHTGKVINEAVFALDHHAFDTLYGQLNGVPFDTYDYNLFDVFISFMKPSLKINPYYYRVGYYSAVLDQEKAKENELWFSYNNDYQVYFKPYGTQKYDNFSFKLSFLPKGSYETYLLLSKKLLKAIKKNSAKENSAKDNKLSTSESKDPKNNNKVSEKINAQETFPNKIKLKIAIGEYPDSATDNGLVFYRFICDHYAHIFDPYYIISKDSPNYDAVAHPAGNRIDYRSLEHVQLLPELDLVAFTHSSDYLLPVVTPMMTELLDHTYKVFLQHGIPSIRDVSNRYGKRSKEHPFANLVVASSPLEKQLLIEKMEYDDDEVVVSGLARFDNLIYYRHDNRYKKDHQHELLIIPTWRAGEDHLPKKEFIETEFFKHWQAFLEDPTLKRLKENYRLSISFYLHHNFQRYADLFDASEVSILTREDTTVQQLLIQNQLLITDYSSVGIDFALMQKPVFYYQFDHGLDESNDSYNPNFKLPGPIHDDPNDLLLAIESCIRYPSSQPVDPKIVEAYYPYNDQMASNRIVSALLDHFYPD